MESSAGCVFVDRGREKKTVSRLFRMHDYLLWLPKATTYHFFSRFSFFFISTPMYKEQWKKSSVIVNDVNEEKKKCSLMRFTEYGVALQKAACVCKAAKCPMTSRNVASSGSFPQFQNTPCDNTASKCKLFPIQCPIVTVQIPDSDLNTFTCYVELIFVTLYTVTLRCWKKDQKQKSAWSMMYILGRLSFDWVFLWFEQEFYNCSTCTPTGCCGLEISPATCKEETGRGG